MKLSFFWSMALCCVGLMIPVQELGAEHPDARNASVNTLTFRHAPGAKLLDVGSATPLRHLDLEMHVTGFHSRRPIGMYSTIENRWLRGFVEHQSGLRLGAALGLVGTTQLHLEMPAVLHQDAQWPGFGLGDAPSAGMGDLEFEAKYRIHAPIRGLTTSLVCPGTFPTGGEDRWLSDDNMTLSPSVIVSRREGLIEVSFRGGYRWADQESIFDLTMGSAVLGGLALGRALDDIYPGLRVAVGTSGEWSTDGASGGNASGGMWSSGLYYDISDGWNIGGIVGGALTESSNMPSIHASFRVTHRIAFGIHPPDCTKSNAWKIDSRCPPPDTDKDGIDDAKDRCIDDPEDMDRFEDEDGCPDPDNDQDKHLDSKDRCPLEPEDYDGFEDEDGCPELDNDGDGIPDETDQCPIIPENMNGIEDQDGCPEPDQDNDGLLDDVDKCPTDPEDKDGFQDQDGCPDKDNDGDGIPDSKDVCPLKPENVNQFKDEDGCPDEVLAVKTRSEIRITEKIHFIHGQVIPRKKSRRVLRAVLKILKDNPELRIRVEGHTDNLGGAEFNELLSQARAQAIKDWMVRKSKGQHRIDERLDVLGVGKAAPIDDNSSKEGRAKNRRVRFLIVDDLGRPLFPEGDAPQ